jgi:16S rRNA pseudouridine516 synthase
MRLDGFIAHATGASRRDAQRYIKEGRVTVDGEIARYSAAKVGDGEIALDGQQITLPAAVYLMLHKPAGYLCANTDGQHPTVLDLIPTRLHPTEPLQIVGRLDLDTTGLLLLTTDGTWNHRITAPNSSCTKVYCAELADPITAEAIATLERGVMLHSETKLTLPCQIFMHSPRCVTITLQEGRYHQVKRMFAAVGNRVTALHREQIGVLKLDPQLPPGAFRHLTPDEVASACP